MLRSGSATSADEPNPGGDELFGYSSPCIPASRVNVAALDGARHAGVGLRGEGKRSDGANPLQGIQHGDGPTLQLHPITSAPQSVSAGEVSGLGAIEAIAIFVDRDLSDDRELGIDFARGENRLVQLFQVTEGFQHDEVDATFVRAAICSRNEAWPPRAKLAQGLDTDAQRPDRSGDIRVETLGGFTGQPRPGDIDFTYFIHTTMPRQPKRIRAEGVCFNDFGAGLKYSWWNLADEVGLREVEFVVTAVDEDPLA